MTRMLALMGCLAFSMVAAGAPAEETLSGFLCCNMHSDGKVISDLNAAVPEQHLIAVGTPIKTTSFHKHKVKVAVESSNESLVNEYSRDLPIQVFAKRYIVQEDPRLRIQAFPKNIQHAIALGHLVKGMTREQVLMSVGYPVSSEVPNLNVNTWVYTLIENIQYRVKFDDKDQLDDVENVIDPRAKLLTE